MQTYRFIWCCLFACSVLCGWVDPAVAQGKSGSSSKPPSCTDIPAQVTLYPVTVNGIPDTSNGGLYGPDNLQAWSYKDGQGGVSAKFSCVTWELFLNLQNTNPLTPFSVDFSKQLATGDVTGPTGVKSGWLLHVANVADLTKYAGGYLNTWSWESLSQSGPVVGPNGALFYCNDPVTFSCGASGTLANKYSPTSLVQVTVASSCASWSIEPLPLPSGSSVAGEKVAGFVKSTDLKGRTSVRSGGQYSMPFHIVVTRTDGIGCTGLPGGP